MSYINMENNSQSKVYVIAGATGVIVAALFYLIVRHVFSVHSRTIDILVGLIAGVVAGAIYYFVVGKKK